MLTSALVLFILHQTGETLQVINQIIKKIVYVSYKINILHINKKRLFSRIQIKFDLYKWCLLPESN